MVVGAFRKEGNRVILTSRRPLNWIVLEHKSGVSTLDFGGNHWGNSYLCDCKLTRISKYSLVECCRRDAFWESRLPRKNEMCLLVEDL